MSGASSDDANKPMEQPKGNLSVTTDNSDETSTPPKNLSDMPIHIVGLIIERSDYRQQLKLRKVSKSLREIVDRQIPTCKTIEFSCARQNIVVMFENHTLIYENHSNELDFESDAETDEEENDDEVEVEDDEEDFGEEEAMEESDDDFDDEEETDDDTIRHIRECLNEAAFDDLASTLKNPRLQLENLYINDGVSKKTDFDRNWNRVHCALKSLNHQLSVKSFGINVSCGSSIASILRHLKPGVLKRISIGSDWIDGSYEMGQVARLDQWKQAEELEFHNCFDAFPMKYATHFKRFVFEELFIDEDKFNRIKNFFSKLDNFEQCILRCDYYGVYEFLGEPTTEEVFHHAIPDSDYYFEIKQPIDSDDSCFHITKKKRDSL